MKKAGVLFAFTIFLIIIIPGIITFLFGTEAEYTFSEPFASFNYEREGAKYEEAEQYTDYLVGSEPVFNDEKPQSQTNISDSENYADGSMGLEEYVCGVVAAEMPAEFGTEALKAQAVAARTYAYRRISAKAPYGNTRVSPEDISNINQAFLSNSELESIWGTAFNDNLSIISNAVYSTRGEIIVYEGEPIEAVFHSSSAGMTEDAANVWNKEYPYLRSVPSGEPETLSEKAFNENELIEIFRNSFSGLYMSDEGFLSQFQILSRTDAGYVRNVQAGNLALTGAQVREALGLKSSAFTVKNKDGKVVFTCKGYGHGVGMSQRGADFLAKNGYGYREILAYYYRGSSIETLEGK